MARKSTTKATPSAPIEATEERQEVADLLRDAKAQLAMVSKITRQSPGRG
jgi:hypothetical protein